MYILETTINGFCIKISTKAEQFQLIKPDMHPISATHLSGKISRENALLNSNNGMKRHRVNITGKYT